MNKENASKNFYKLLEIVEQLRGPDGCDWDKKTCVRCHQEEDVLFAKKISGQRTHPYSIHTLSFLRRLPHLLQHLTCLQSEKALMIVAPLCL